MRSGFLLYILFYSLIFLSACGSKTSDNSSVFRYNENAGITSLDPAFARGLENMWAVNQLFDGLVELDSNLQVAPLIASSWEISNGGKDYTFHLRDDVYFHTNILFGTDSTRKVNAHDFVYSFNRIVDEEIASPGQWVFNQVDFSK